MSSSSLEVVGPSASVLLLGRHHPREIERSRRMDSPPSPSSSSSFQSRGEGDCNYRSNRHIQFTIPNSNREQRNLISVSFITLGIGFLSTGLLSAGWFQQTSNPECTRHLAPYLFFDPGTWTEHRPVIMNSSSTPTTYKSYDCHAGRLKCINPELVMFMRWIIGLSLMAILFGLLTFYLELTGPTSHAGRKMQEHGSITLMFVITTCLILSLAYLAVIVWEQELRTGDDAVSYEYGFWTVVAATWFGLMSLMSTWIRAIIRRIFKRWRIQTATTVSDAIAGFQSTSGDTQGLLQPEISHRESFWRDDLEETFIHGAPPPPYSVSASIAHQNPPPPPYAP